MMMYLEHLIHYVSVLYAYTQVQALNAEEVDSSHAQLSETKELEHTSTPDDGTPIAAASAAPSKDNTDASPENVNLQGDVQPQSQDVQIVDNSTPVEQTEMPPVKQSTTKEEVVVTKVNDDAEAAPMDTSSVVLPVNEQIGQIAESATAQPESCVTIQSDISIVAHPEVMQKVPQKQVLSQQIEAPAKSKVAIKQPVAPPSRETVSRQPVPPVAPPSRETVSQQPVPPIQKSQPQVTEIKQEKKQEKKQELVCFCICMCVCILYSGFSSRKVFTNFAICDNFTLKMFTKNVHY